MQFVLSDQNDKCVLEKERVRIKSLKNLCGQLFSPKYVVVRRTTRSQFLVVLTGFFCRRGHANFATLPLQIPSANYICSNYV